MSSAIENLNQFGGQFLKFAWPMLWQSSLLIVLVLMADVLTARKIRASVRHALWLVVLAKLLLPPTLALPTGAAWWLFPAKPVVVPALQTPVANNYTVVVDDAPLPADFVSEPVPIIEPPKPKLTGAGWMLLASGVVSAGLLVWLVFRWGQLAHKVRGATKISKIVSPENMAEVFELARRRAGLRAGARLKLVEGRMSPAVCGLFRPVILLPRLLVEKLSAAQLQAVLLHEMIHLRRGDIWVNCAQSLLQIFYWWHPLVWVANARMRRVREESVDDGVMLALADEAETYAPTLLEVAKLAFRRPLLSLGLVGIMESRSALRQRIERLMDFRAPRKAGLTLVSVCGIFVFSAVAVPMGQGPARVVRETSQTVTVDSSNNIPGTATGILSSPNFQTALRALEQRTGVKNLSEPQITTASGRGENRAGIFPAQEASTEEYRPDFIKENQIGDTPFPKTVIDAGPYSPAEMFAQINQSAIPAHASGTAANSAPSPDGQTTNTPEVMITAEFYQMSAGDFESLVSGLQFNHGATDKGEWWSGARDEFSKFQNRLEASGLVPLSSPRIKTSSGGTTETSIGNGKTETALSCWPKVTGGQVDLTINGKVVDMPTDKATSQFAAKAILENHAGMVVHAQNAGGAGVSNVMVVVTVQILSDSESARFQQRLVPITKPAATNDPANSSTNGVMLYMRTFRIDANTFLTKLETNGFLTKLRTQPHPGGLDLSTNSTGAISAALRQLFTDEGVVLTSPPGKSVYYNDRRGVLFVTATEADLDKIERVLQKFLPPPPQLHIKARFISVPQNTMAGLGNSLHGLDPTNGQFTEILTGTNMQAVLQALRSQKGVETLGEQEIIMLSGRREEMRTTWMMTVVTNLTSDGQGAVVPQTADFELGPILDVTPHVLGDGFTINLKAVPALTEFLGYLQSTSVVTSQWSGQTTKSLDVLPILQTQKLRVEANLRDNQTLVLGGFAWQASPQQAHPKAGDVPVLGRPFRANVVTNDVLVFITATIIDRAGNRVHTEGERAPGQSEIPEQPATTNRGGVEFSTPEPAQLPGHREVPRQDPGESDRLLQEGENFFEAAMLKEAKAKFAEVIQLEPHNATALSYFELIERMQVQLSVSPTGGGIVLPMPNPYATNHLIFTGSGRRGIMAKLDKIHLDTVSYDGLPLTEVLKQLAEQSRLRDPERRGINFLINNSPDGSSLPPASANAGGSPNLDPVTGFLAAPAVTPEQPDAGSFIIKIPSLSDVRLADVLDAITLVSDHPLKYSIQDFAVVFSAKSPESPQLFMRTFKVDPNTFYSGLENVGNFGVVRNGGGGGSSQSQNNGAVVGVVNAFPGANNVLGTAGGGAGGGRSEQSLQGSSYITNGNPVSTPSALARRFFSCLGVNLNDPPGKSVFYNDRLGYLFVKATETDLDTIERALQVVGQTPPQLHIKARFIEVPKGMRDDLKATNPVFGKPIWILTNTNFHAVLRDLESYKNVETLGEPEVTMLSGRRVQMRATEMITVVTNVLFQEDQPDNPGTSAMVPQTGSVEIGPALDAVPYVLADGYTINLAAIPSLKQFLGYDQPQPTSTMPGQAQPPMPLPRFQTQQIQASVNLWDSQTLVLGGLTKQEWPKEKKPVAGDIPLLGRLFQTMSQTTNMDVLVFITVTIVDPAGNRVHSDDEMPFAKNAVPPQPTTISSNLAALSVPMNRQSRQVKAPGVQAETNQNPAPPDIHMKARFYEAPKGTLDSMRKIMNATNPADGTLMGILTSRNAKAVIHVLQSLKGIEALGEPDITMLSGHRVIAQATEATTVVTNTMLENSRTNQAGAVIDTIEPQTCTLEFGPVLDAMLFVQADGYTIKLSGKALRKEFFGYAIPPKNMATWSVTNSAGEPIDLANVWPAAQTRSQSANVNLFDGQTLLLSLPEAQAEQIRFSAPDEKREEAVAKHIQAAWTKAGERETLVFITTSIVDSKGVRVHSDEQLPLGPEVIPPQPQELPAAY